MKNHFFGVIAAVALLGASSAAFAAARVHHPAADRQTTTESTQLQADGTPFLAPHETEQDRVMVEQSMIPTE